MNKLPKTQLGNAVKYSTKRVSLEALQVSNYVTTDNLLQNKRGVADAINLPPNTLKVSKYEYGHILISNIRPYLKKIWFANKSGGCSADVLNLETNDNYDPKFVYYSIFSDDFFAHMMKGAKGSKMPRGDKNQILTYLIPDISISEQKKIINILSDLDCKIELNNTINRELETIAKTIYDYWFVQFDFPDEHGKPYKSSGGKMVWSDDLKKEIPEGWEVNSLGHFMEVFDSKRIPLSKTERSKRQGLYPYYGATVLMDYINDFLFEGDYLLLAEDGSVMDSEGYPNLQFVSGKFWVNNHAHVIRAKSVQNNEFLFRTLKYIPVIKMMTGSVQMKINQENLLSFKIVIPSDQILAKASELLSPLRKQILMNENENNELIKLRDWLLPMLMNGQINVSTMNSNEKKN